MENAARQKWSLTQEAFNLLLTALGPDRDSAANRYLEIRRNLVHLFEWRGCPAPDDDADETINRCARKLAEGIEIRDIATFCVGIARMLVLERGHSRARQERPLDEFPEFEAPPKVPDHSEQHLQCLDRCLGLLSNQDRNLILRYYQGNTGEKIRNRKGLTQLFGLSAGTLRMRALRLRERLQACSEDCLHRRENEVL